jgi:hypothetical protein
MEGLGELKTKLVISLGIETVTYVGARGSLADRDTVLSRKVAGSRHGEVTELSNLPQHSSCTMPLEFTQPLTTLVPETETCFWIVQCGRFLRITTSPPSVSRLSRNCGIFDFAQPYRLPQPVTRTALHMHARTHTCIYIYMCRVHKNKAVPVTSVCPVKYGHHLNI